jgi:hypothetical protein
MKFENGDTVKIKNGGTEVFWIRETREAGPLYLLQLGNDGANIQWQKEEEIELVAKVKKPDTGPGLVPERGIMG